MGYDVYDPTKKEIQRCHAELEDYHEYIANLQYFPSKTETEFLIERVPVEISGDPSEKYEISSALFKDLPRISTNRLRSGYCLIHSACIPLKAPKLWAKLQSWGKELNMQQWDFLEEFIKIQTEMKAKGKKKKDTSLISPDYTYIKDLVGGRPVLGHPLCSGAFRIRYGRARTSGFSAQAIHPASMITLNNFVATGTQLKVERPGKAAAYSACDTIEGPIIKLKSGDVIYVEDELSAKKYKEDIEEILYAGDVLINYGDFFDRAHRLVPPGYCEEIWIQEFEESAVNLYWTLDPEKISDLLSIDSEKINTLLNKPLKTKISFFASKEISLRLDIPLHPKYTFHWKSIRKEDIKPLREWLKTASISEDKIVLKNNDSKRSLELIGLPHKLVNKEFVVIEKDNAKAIIYVLGLDHEISNSDFEKYEEKSNNSLELINKLCRIIIKDKSGTFLGSRMGRPEKAKMRKLTGSPHSLFPVGEEGGRLRSFQAAIEKGHINAEFKMFKSEKTGELTPFSVCEKTGSKTTPVESTDNNKKTRINIYEIMEDMKKKLGTRILPDLIKGVRGTSNKEHIAEHLIKGILRAKHGIAVNKDGTVRYDCSEVTLTHFKPKEIQTPIEKLIELGYEKDIDGRPLTNENQILELKVQDIVIPCSTTNPEEPADEILFRVSKFIDELLEKLYGLKPFYNLQSKQDLAGQLAIGLAPHTSAGIVTRIIGFSKTQAYLAHPYVHAAMRRDCDGDESCILLLMDAFLNFSQKFLPSSRGSVMDAPLVLTSKIVPTEVDDMIFNMDIVWKYPLEFYRAAEEYKMPFELSIKKVGDVVDTEQQYEKMGFTHDTTNINSGVTCSAYKLLPSMAEKVAAQMDIAVKLRAVDEKDVAKLIINKHFIRDTKGNLRKFSLQQFRCVGCNEKFRRPPLSGKCTKCNGKIIFTISEGSIVKYIQYCKDLAEKYDLDIYTKQMIELTVRRIEGVFGKEKEIQTGLGAFV